VAYDPELFRREILARLALVKLSETAEAAGCSKPPRRTSAAGRFWEEGSFKLAVWRSDRPVRN
jgi:hypothetical protein